MVVISLKEQVVRTDTEKADYRKVVTWVSEDADWQIVCLNVAIVGRKWAEMVVRKLMTKLVNAAHAVVQQLGYDAENRLPHRLERGIRLYACPARWP